MSPEQADVLMKRALELARAAAARGEVPVGALVVDKDGAVIGEGANWREARQDCTEHAEMDALRAACAALKSWRLPGCELVVTLEPCLMCAGAIYQARLAAVWFGAVDPKAGAMGSLYKVHEDERLNHRLPVVGGVRAGECGDVLKEFFRGRRR